MEVETQTEWTWSPHVVLPDPSSLFFWSTLIPPPPPSPPTFLEDECDAFHYLRITVENPIPTDEILLTSNDEYPEEVLISKAPLMCDLKAADQILEINGRSIDSKDAALKMFCKRMEFLVARVNLNHDHDRCLHSLHEEHPQRFLIDKPSPKFSINVDLKKEMNDLQIECEEFMKDLESMKSHRSEDEALYEEPETGFTSLKVMAGCDKSKSQDLKNISATRINLNHKQQIPSKSSTCLIETPPQVFKYDMFKKSNGKNIEAISLPKYDPKDKRESIKNWIKTSLDLPTSTKKEKVAICKPNFRKCSQEKILTPNSSSSDSSRNKSIFNKTKRIADTTSSPSKQLTASTTMYTNVANLQHTINLQQKLLKMSIREKREKSKMTKALKKSTSFQFLKSEPLKLPTSCSTHEFCQEHIYDEVSPEKSVRWKIRRRADGSRYVTSEEESGSYHNRIKKAEAKKTAILEGEACKVEDLLTVATV